MLQIKRTNNDNPDFKLLVAKLDKDLWDRYGEMQLEYQHYNLIENLPTIVIIYENNKPVGCGCFKYFSQESVELKRMFVEPEYRSRGIGTTIIAELEKWAIELGYTAMVLETSNGQPEAIHLYKKYGFVEIPRYGQYAGKEKSICMKKVFT